jgi:hypothetical protein
VARLGWAELRWRCIYCMEPPCIVTLLTSPYGDVWRVSVHTKLWALEVTSVWGRSAPAYASIYR